MCGLACSRQSSFFVGFLALVSACSSPNAGTSIGSGGSRGAGTGGAQGTGGVASDGSSAAVGGATGNSSGGAIGAGAGGQPGTGGAASGGPDAGNVGTGGGNVGGAGRSGGAGGAASGLGGEMAAPIAATPPMGWNSWNTFQCNISEALIKAVADTFVTSGMQAAGYQYVNIDDCWMNGRDASGHLTWNTAKFPSGIPALVAYVHGKGLKFGIYESANTDTCVGIYGGISPTVAVGSLGHEVADAATFASWGVDFLKHDLCKGDRNSFAKMRDGLRATGRPIVYSINPGNGSTDICPPNACALPLVNIANMWRISIDITGTWASITSLIDQDAPLYSYAGPGHWNDPDMLEVGRGLTAGEDRAHFSMWSILAAPLIAGNDVRSMSGTTLGILTNKDVVAIDQDPLGTQGRLVATPATNLQVWSKTLSGASSRAVVLLNRTGSSASITATWSALGLPPGNATVRDLWSHVDLGTFNGSYTANGVPSHDVAMLKITSSP